MRIPFQSTVCLKALSYKGQPMCNGLTRDLCLRGFYFYSATILSVGTPCEVRLNLSGSTTELSLRMKGVVVRAEAAGMAVLFQELDTESLCHLKNILCEKSISRPGKWSSLCTPRTEH